MTDLSLLNLEDDIRKGRFLVTDICPNGPCCWLVFGRHGDPGTRTEKGARRMVYGLTREIERVTGWTYLYAGNSRPAK